MHGSTMSFSQAIMDVFKDTHRATRQIFFFMLIFLPCYLSEFLCPFQDNDSFWRSIPEATFECGFKLIFPSTTIFISGEQLGTCIMGCEKTMNLHPWPSEIYEPRVGVRSFSFCFLKTLDVGCFVLLVVSFKKFSS